jgi:hypothetical protein
LGRSPHTVKKYLVVPEIAEDVKKEKAVLAEMFENVARRTVEGVTDKDIEKAGLKDKMIAAGIATEKSLLLKGQATSIDVHILLDLVEAVREHRNREDQEYLRRYREKLSSGDQG